ncbi:MAG TPA: metalloregulator ArsR/SmtB family transcription factor [Vicinamibacterales bacterium]
MGETQKAPGPSPAFTLPRARTLPVNNSQDCVVALRALGEETRVRIVGLLIDGALDVGEISRRLDISPYNASKHLRILREAGLLELQKDGRRHLYALPDTMRRRASNGGVLDLGCCSFQFSKGSGPRPRAGNGRASKRTDSRRG